MAWTTPKTWSSEPLTSNDLNTYIRDNQVALRAIEQNRADYIGDESSDYSTTSATFVDVDGTNLSFDVTPAGDALLVGFVGSVRGWDAGAQMRLDIAVDGTPVNGDDGLLVQDIANVNGYQRQNVSFVWLVDGLTPDEEVTISLQWFVTGGTATLYAGAGTSVGDSHPQMWIQEI